MNCVTYIAEERTRITGNICYVTTTHRCVTSPRKRITQPPLLLRVGRVFTAVAWQRVDQIRYNTQWVNIFQIYIHSKFRMPSPNVSLVIPIASKAKETSRTGAIRYLTFHKIINWTNITHLSSITIHLVSNWTLLYQAAVYLLYWLKYPDSSHQQAFTNSSLLQGRLVDAKTKRKAKERSDSYNKENPLKPSISISIICFNIVVFRSRCCATTARWADIPGKFLGNGSVNTFPLLGSRFLIIQHLDYNNGEMCFLRGPCREVITETRFGV
jgi:hypothetical protein